MSIGIGIGFGFKNNVGTGSSYTARTQAFLTATGITDSVIAGALNTMDLALISAGLLPSGTGAGKIKALYPFVGGTATTHKFNFVDPQDADASFRLVFSGGWTHSSNGALPNGTNGYATSYLLSNSLGQNDFHCGFYSRTNATGIYDDLAVYDTQFGVSMYTKATINSAINSNSNTQNLVLTSDSLGFFLQSRIASNQFYFRAKGSTNTLTRTSETPRAAYFIFSRTGNASAEYSPRQLAFGTIGTGLTTTEITSYENIVISFQTTLGRNV